MARKHESIQDDTGFFCWPHGDLGNECGSKAAISLTEGPIERGQIYAMWLP